MKLRAPMYYRDFKCIADKCKHSCCLAGWEIDIDDKTAEFYKSVNGDFGNKLQNNIKSEDSGTRHFVLNKDGSCPFLNKCGLCDIYINLGEDKLCQICTDHPRFYEWFDGVKEAGIGLCCEEAARIILSQSDKFSTYEIDIPDEDCDEYDDEIYEYLCKCRDKIIEYLDGDSCNIIQLIKDVLWYGNMVQLDLDSGLLDDEEIISVEDDSDDVANDAADKKAFYAKAVDFLCSLEPNNNDWIPYLQECLKIYESTSNKMNEFIDCQPEVYNYLKNLAIYYIWRYFLKGVFDGDVICKLKLMCFGIIIARWLMYCKWLENRSISLSDCVDIVRRFSEEIEYSDENLECFFDECFDGDIFEIEQLMKML